MVTTDATEHRRHRYMEATFKGNHKTIVYLSGLFTTFTEHIRFRNMVAIFKGNYKTIVNPIFLCLLTTFRGNQKQ